MYDITRLSWSDLTVPSKRIPDYNLTHDKTYILIAESSVYDKLHVNRESTAILVTVFKGIASRWGSGSSETSLYLLAMPRKMFDHLVDKGHPSVKDITCASFDMDSPEFESIHLGKVSNWRYYNFDYNVTVTLSARNNGVTVNLYVLSIGDLFPNANQTGDLIHPLVGMNTEITCQFNVGYFLHDYVKGRISEKLFGTLVRTYYPTLAKKPGLTKIWESISATYEKARIENPVEAVLLEYLVTSATKTVNGVLVSSFLNSVVSKDYETTIARFSTISKNIGEYILDKWYFCLEPFEILRHSPDYMDMMVASKKKKREGSFQETV